MICKKCGKALPSEGAICTFCGASMNKDQLEKRKQMQEKNNQARLMSDKYGIDKSMLYKQEEQKENKLIGLAVILGVLLFLVILVIIVNVGK